MLKFAVPVVGVASCVVALLTFEGVKQYMPPYGIPVFATLVVAITAFGCMMASMYAGVIRTTRITGTVNRDDLLTATSATLGMFCFAPMMTFSIPYPVMPIICSAVVICVWSWFVNKQIWTVKEHRGGNHG